MEKDFDERAMCSRFWMELWKRILMLLFLNVCGRKLYLSNYQSDGKGGGVILRQFQRSKLQE